MTDETRQKLRESLTALAEEDVPEADAKDAIARLVPRFRQALRTVGIGLAIPCGPGRSVTEETLSCAGSFVGEMGLKLVTVQSFEVANNREKLLRTFLKAGYRKLLWLDSDNAVDANGLGLMLETMERWRCAMVSALVFQRYVGGEGSYNAFVLGEDGKHQALKRASLPQSLTAFPVDFCGLAVALVDLDKIREANAAYLEKEGKEATWFRRNADGFQHYGEDLHFCRMLTERGLDFVVDPRVSTIHAIQERFVYSPMVAPAVKTR